MAIPYRPVYPFYVIVFVDVDVPIAYSVIPICRVLTVITFSFLFFTAEEAA